MIVTEFGSDSITGKPFRTLLINDIPTFSRPSICPKQTFLAILNANDLPLFFTVTGVNDRCFLVVFLLLRRCRGHEPTRGRVNEPG
jgi:hypothetical protein